MPLPEPCDHVGRGLHLTRFDLTTPQREDLEQRQGLLRLLVTSDILTTALASPFWVMTKGSPWGRERTRNLGGVRSGDTNGSTTRTVSNTWP